MKKSRKLLMLLAAAMLLIGCPKESTSDEDDDDDDDDDAVATATAKTPATKPSVAEIAPEDPNAGSGITSRVKDELDNKDPASTEGTPFAVSGAAESFVIPTGWTNAKSGTFATAKSADSKAWFAGSNVATGENAQAKRDGAVAALGFTDCKWGSNIGIAIGKEKIAAQAADGVCKKGDATVPTAFISLPDLAAVGGWEEGSEAKGIWSTFRNIKKAGKGGDSTGIAACCAAISQNMQSAPPQHKMAYQLALGACNAAKSSPQGRQALSGVRAALAGAGVPAPCQ